MHREGILYDLNGGLRAFSDNIREICNLTGVDSMTDDDESEFARLLPGVKRLRNDRINLYRQRGSKKSPPRASREEIDRHTDFPADSLPARDTRFDSGLQKKLQRKIRQGLIRPETSIDLHGYRQTEAVQALDSFIAEALQRRLRMVLVIHGQGYRSQSDAILKPLVQRWLENQSQVLAWCPAQARDGAAGATYVYLRTN
jgi:DNA-nicking Smr family endonuclease